LLFTFCLLKDASLSSDQTKSPAPILPAATVLLVRGSDPFEIYVVQRADILRFFGGFYAFPGGKVSAGDADVPVAIANGAERERIRAVAAVRELFEETGVLIARYPDGTFPASYPDLDQQRRDLAVEGQAFAQFLARHHLAVRLNDLVPLGQLVTPPFAAVRFDTSFFLATCPPRQQPQVWPGELQEGRWTTPAAMLTQWERGDCLVSPPTVRILQTIRDVPLDQVPSRLAAMYRDIHERAIHPIYFAPDVQLIPLRSQALPPSTHTNAYLVGNGPMYVIDPGTPYMDEQQQLFGVLDERQAAGRHLTAVVLTHQHPDHVGAAVACAERYGVPIWAHSLTAQALAGKVPVARRLREGETLPLGRAADGFADWRLDALHTPGHAAGHLAFYDPHYRLLFAGDMVSTQTTVVIAPPGGDLAMYLQSLRRLGTYDVRLLLPAHGNPTARVQQTLEEILEHRRKREEALLAALSAVPRSEADLALELYKGVPDPLMKFAQLQVRSGLHKLRAEGRAQSIETSDEVCWRLGGSIEPGHMENTHRHSS
jgi:glyoxylase-like metal-dependent hydrolase (beta-lactamase superfamily II)/8-oxo-dGTP pyrophosphatase MutT (NUDIX family)